MLHAAPVRTTVVVADDFVLMVFVKPVAEKPRDASAVEGGDGAAARLRIDGGQGLGGIENRIGGLLGLEGLPLVIQSQPVEHAAWVGGSWRAAASSTSGHQPHHLATRRPSHRATIRGHGNSSRDADGARRVNSWQGRTVPQENGPVPGTRSTAPELRLARTSKRRHGRVR